jgi:hypothetical protein
MARAAAVAWHQPQSLSRSRPGTSPHSRSIRSPDHLGQRGAPRVNSAAEPGDQPFAAALIQHEVRVKHALIVAGGPGCATEIDAWDTPACLASRTTVQRWPLLLRSSVLSAVGSLPWMAK